MSSQQVGTFENEIPFKRITSERYLSPAYMELEREKIWGKMWLVAGVESDVVERGDYFIFDLDPESIIVCRTENADLRAFYNVCQHRGNKLVAQQMGCLERFTCPYHGWQFENDGALSKVPEEHRFSAGVPRDELSLKAVRVEAWAGLIWVCMDPQGPTLSQYLGPIKEMIEPFQTAKMALVEDQACRLNCNWKAVIDNFSELYHVEHIHPQHECIFDCPTSKQEFFPGGHTRVLIDGFTVNTNMEIPEEVPRIQWPQLEALGMEKEDYRGRILDVRRDVQIKKRQFGKALGYDYDLLSDDQLSDIVQYNLFPNSVLVLQAEEFWILRARPRGEDPNACYWDKLVMRMLPDDDLKSQVSDERRGANNTADIRLASFNPDQSNLNVERPLHDEFDQEAIISGEKTMTITVDQDIHLLRDVQKGMKSRGFKGSWLNEDESRVQHYHDYLEYCIHKGDS